MQENCGLNLIKENNGNKLLFNIPGADINPYLTVYGIIESMKSGLKNNLNLKQELQNISGERLPINLNRSISNFDKSEYMKNLLGEDIHFHFGAFYNFEFVQFNSKVDEWERERYMYQI